MTVGFLLLLLLSECVLMVKSVFFASLAARHVHLFRFFDNILRDESVLPLGGRIRRGGCWFSTRRDGSMLRLRLKEKSLLITEIFFG
jgi:hypothetical protein